MARVMSQSDHPHDDHDAPEAAGAAPAPYLSIVATARNDDHGGNLLGRMQIFIDALATQCARHGLDAELVLVEWNPPADRASLRDALRWPADNGPLSVRLITVPPEVHARHRHADRLPLFQMIAKNVGIRRSRGAFVLATNIDLIFSDELIGHLARRQLRTDRMYRIDRHDCDADVPVDADLDAQLAYCRENVLRVNQRDAVRGPAGERLHTIYWPMTWRVALLDALQDLRLIPTVTRKRLHVNGCGDFTLMARDRWFALRGYPELEIFSMHLDALLCNVAHFAGVREHHLRDPMRIYHIEHGSGWSIEGEAALNQRLAAAGIEQLTHEQYHRWAVRMRRDREPMTFNDEHWGLARQRFDETRCAAPGVRRTTAASHAAAPSSAAAAPQPEGTFA